MQGIKLINMKKSLWLFSLSVVIVLQSCIKNDPVLYTNALAEIDATALNANAAGLTYPVLARVVPAGRAQSTTTDSTLRRYAQTYRLRVNLVGPQSSKDETVGLEFFTSPITSFGVPATISGQLPALTATTLTISDAIVGTHFAALPGTITIPAKSSFGFIDLKILPSPSGPGEGRFVGIKLNNSGTIKTSVNYSQLGLVIDQR
jgi:hypothetical protein